MKRQPRFWALVSAALFLAGGYCWHLGNQRAARTAPLPVTNNPAATNAGGKSRAERPGPIRLLSGPPSPSTVAALQANGVSLSGTNRFRYRLSNTAQTPAQMLRNEQAVLLRNALIDTSLRSGLNIPAHLRAPGDPGSYVVQARGVITEAFRKAIREAGGEVVSYVPNNAYLVRAEAAAARRLARGPLTQAVLPFEPYYKLEPTLLARAVEGMPLPENSLLSVTLFPGQRQAAAGALAAIEAQIVSEEPSPFGPTLHLRARGQALAELARLPQVQIIEKGRERIPANDLTRARLNISTNTTTASSHLGLTGSGVTVQVADTGVWADHPDLQGRVIGETNSLGDGDGHGTHVAGTIGSSGVNSTALVTGTNVPGSTNGADFRGMAPASTIYSLQVMGAFQGGHFVTDAQMQRLALLSNAFICNNSWSYGVFDYTLASASFDAATRDALDDRTGSQPLLFVFAAGNSGNGQNDGLGGAPGSIEAPGTAKNVITVGASELYRRIANTVTNIVMEGGLITTNITQPWLGMTDSSNEVAAFSSRGNTGILEEGSYGRYKPDVVAPGAMVISCRTTNFSRVGATNLAFGETYTNLYLPPRSTNNFFFLADAPGLISFTVNAVPSVTTTAAPPVLPIHIAMDRLPTAADFKGNNTATIVPPELTQGAANYSVGNPGSNSVSYNLSVTLVISNSPGDYFTVLSNLNARLDPNNLYRYEWGSSMAAAAVSGTLALMQEYFARDLGVTNPSPAVLKALLINGARSMHPTKYDFNFRRTTANPQGWGLPNLANSVPAKAAGATDSVVQYVEQDPTNALTTGFSHTRTINVAGANLGFPLRLSLVWTDPAANPLMGAKLVNDLDLIVTNLANPDEVYVGNFFREGGLYSQVVFTNAGGVTNPVSPSANASNFVSALDLVNNVENVYLPPPLSAGGYSVTVRARRVHVNGVDAAPPSGVYQDYALVASCGVTNFLTGGQGSFSLSPAITLGAATNAGVRLFTTNHVQLMHERVGANPPYLVTTNGVTEQWNFYVYTNSTLWTNVAFLTFMPRNIGFLQPNRAQPARPRYREADLDLFVSQSAGLTNLDPVVIGGSDRSVKRGGTEMIVYSNSTFNAVYYIGIKSEDQQAADYSFLALASESPFSNLDSNGNQVIHGYVVEIPDGTPDYPGGTTVVALATMPMTVQRVVAETSVEHELISDLSLNLSHSDDEGGEVWAVLHNHSTNGPTVTYDDSQRDDIPDAVPPDGPGGLTNFMGMEAFGPWFLDVVDNAYHHTGRVESLTLTIEPLQETNDMAYPSRLIGAGEWSCETRPLVVPLDATNVQICVQVSGGPVDLYIMRDVNPTLTSFYWAATNVSPPGVCFDWSIYDVPPLLPGIYYLCLFNPNTRPITAGWTLHIDRDGRPGSTLVYASTNSTYLLDDAVTNGFIFVTNDQEVASIEVGVRIDHSRASDLVLHLVSPSGARLLLAENRGWTNQLGYGASVTNISTNFLATILDNGFEDVDANGSPFLAGSVVSGWAVTNGDVKVIPGGGLLGFIPNSGTNALDINGTTGGWILTNLATRPGSNYLVTFAFARNPDSVLAGGGFQPQADVRVDGSNRVTVIPTDASPSWNNVVWTTNSFLFTAANPAGSTLELFSPSATPYGVLFDSFKVEEIVIQTNLYRYCTFSENPGRARTPIKFGEPPYANTNQFLTNLVAGSFETVPSGTYDNAKGLFEGWLTATNRAGVVTDPSLALDGSNFLALSSAEVGFQFHAIPDAEYRLEFSHRGPDPAAWWPFDRNPPTDLLSGILAEYWGAPNLVAAEVNRGVALDGLGDYVRVPQPLPVSIGTDLGLTIETWVLANNLTTPPADQPLVEWNSGLGAVGVNFWISQDPPAGGGPASLSADLVDDAGNSHRIVSGPNVLQTGFQHLAVTYQAWNGDAALYVNGIQVAFTNLGVFPLATAYDLYFGLRASGPGSGRLLQGVMDEVTLFNRGLAPSEIWGIANATTNGKYDPLSPQPNFTVSVSNVFTNTIAALTNWTSATLSFVAASSNTVIQLTGNPLGVLIDKVRLVETGSKFYLPEEPLSPMFGENALGPWRLEVWDNRLGGPLTNAELLSWSLNLGFVRSNLLPVHLTNSVAYSNAVVDTNLLFFIVDANCTNGGSITHSLVADAPVDLLFNRSGPPTTTLGDVVLLSGVTNGTNVLNIGGLPLPQPGRYFLAVRNTYPTNTAHFTLQADIACLPGLPFLPTIGAGGVSYAGGQFRMEWLAPTWASFLVQYAESLAAPVWITLPRVVTSPSGVFSFVDETLPPDPALATNRYYRIVQLPP